MNRSVWFFLIVVAIGGAVVGYSTSLMPATYASIGASVIGSALVIAGLIGVRSSIEIEPPEPDDDLLKRWQRHADDLQGQLERERERIRDSALPAEAEAIRMAIESNADQAGSAIHALLNNLLAFKATVPQLAARLEAAERERDDALHELGIVDEMQARRRVLKGGIPRVADFAPPPREERHAPETDGNLLAGIEAALNGEEEPPPPAEPQQT